MNREEERKEIDEILKVYEETIGDGNNNIFSLDKFLMDSGLPQWSMKYLTYFYSYFYKNKLTDNLNLIFYNHNDFIIYGFNIENYALEFLMSMVETKDDKYYDNVVIESIPSIRKIGFLNVFNPEHFNYILSKLKTNENILFIETEYFIHFEELFIPPPEPQVYYPEDEAVEAREVEARWDEPIRVEVDNLTSDGRNYTDNWDYNDVQDKIQEYLRKGITRNSYGEYTYDTRESDDLIDEIIKRFPEKY